MHTKIAALILLTACTSGARDGSEAASKPAEVSEPAKPLEPAPVAAAPQAEPEPEPTPTLDAAATGPSLHLVATVEKPERDEAAPHFRVFAGADGEVFVSAGPQVIRIGADGSFERDAGWLRGIEAFENDGEDGLFALAMWDVIAAGGRWPEGLYITVSAEFGYRHEGFPNWVYRRTGDGWVAVKTKGSAFHWFVADVAPWKDGSVLALRNFTPIHEYRGDPDDETREPTKASMQRAAAAIDRQRPLIVIRGAPKAPDLGRRDIAAIDAVASGEIVGLVTGEAPLAVHFDPNSGTVTERPLPKGGPAEGEVLVEGSARAWIYGRTEGDPNAPYLVRFDGEAWTEQPAPACDHSGIGSFSRSPEGESWAVCGNMPSMPIFEGEQYSLWHRAADSDPWTQVKLPDGVAPSEVLARGRNDVWVAGTALLHSRAPARVTIIPGYSTQWFEMMERGEPVAPFSCEHGTILVDGAPAGEHAELAAAIDKAFGDVETGTVELVEVPFRDEPRLAVQHHFVEDKRATQRVKQALGDRMREAYCFTREPTRDLGGRMGAMLP